MGASRKLQGEIDRVLKKVQEGVDVFDSIWNKVYDTDNVNQKEKFEADLKKEIKKLQRYRDQIKTWIQSSEIKDKKALMDARKLIEREMERFKICEKETKTKAFSKEGLGQQPKTDPKEKAKSETRDWLNNAVGDLESQIDNFEAEVEGFSVKKGKMKNPRLTHLETSIGRHKAHIMKLELILRLLDNDELSPDQVNDLKEFLEDYVECNQDDFERFGDVDGFYSSLPLEVEALEDLVTIPSGLTKAALSLASQQNTDQDQSEETASQDSNSDIALKTPPSKTGSMGSLVSTTSPSLGPGMPTGPSPATAPSASARPIVGPSMAAILSSPVDVRGVMESPIAASQSLVNSNSVKEDDDSTFPGRRPSPAIPEIALGRGISSGVSNQAAVTASSSMSPLNGISGYGDLGSVPAVSDMSKREMLSVDEIMGNGDLTPSLASPLSNRAQQVSKSNDVTSSNGTSNVGASPAISGRLFSPSITTGVQWRPQNSAVFENPNEMGQFHGRPEISPDQREKFLQRLQQVQQQGHNTLINVPHLSGANPKQFSMQQQGSLLQQFNSQSSSLSPQLGLGLNIQSPGLSSVSSAQLQPPIHQQSSQPSLISTAPKDSDVGHSKGDEQQQQNFTNHLNVESKTNSTLSKIVSDEGLKSPYKAACSSTLAESNQFSNNSDLLPGQPLQPTQSSASHGVIGRRSVPDVGANNFTASAGNTSIMHDQTYNMQMLDAAFYKLPHPRDSERAKNYIPRHPVVTPPSFPQTQVGIVENPAFWERMSIEQLGTDTLFFAFYYQQNTYQQYLAARELKRYSWRYHRKYNTWFQRHAEPNVTNDEYEKGTYVYFDFHIADEPQNGWCQRIKNEFTFEYNYLEDELVE
ncbi:CCR4-NOT transcription complex subunit 3-like isoform X2 [Asparagus officinalis]|uniref:CCR4-NOT transcription complex subunit 3-like isoform X2 n=1 Tax=Asparagus officinalis TaxID=4686 RepID=UPI00098E758A|nr:CCR4-NOT transcription complex subunit 3-like isoform X2 [Asparagus officinalis]